jgi:general secretion pathway protein D
MSMKRSLTPQWASLPALGLAAAGFLAAPAVAQAPAGPAAASAPAPAPARGARAPRAATVTTNFVNADIEAVTRAFAAMLERPIIVDPRVRGQITVYSEQPQTIPQAYASYQSALRGLGFAVIENSGLLKVVPEADAKLQAGTVSIGAVPAKGEQIITQIFPLRYENPNNLVAVLRPLITANNTINANPGSNSLIITDYADNLQRMSRIIAALDQPPGTDVEIIPLQHGVAADLAPLVQRLSEGGGPGVPGVPGAVGGGAATIIADSRSNSLIVRAPNPARLAQIKANIERLDKPTNLIGPGGGMWVVNLKNADAVKLATVVRAAFGALGGSGGGGGGISPTAPAPIAAAVPGQPAPQSTAPVQGSAQPSTGGFIQADPSTNSLIITAPEPLYKQVRALIDQLDSRRAQVYIESMIVEVSGGDAADFGFQWQGLIGKDGDSVGAVAGTNFRGPGRPSIIDITAAGASGSDQAVGQAVASLGQGLNIGILRNIGGVYTLAGIARMLQSQSNTNIVSTPNLITLDNEEAKIVVGENVPFITGQFSNTGAGGGGATVNPFQTIERKDVGITLRIKPQIGESGAIRMTIFQEQSSVKQEVAAGTSNAGPSTTKRSIEGTVVVDDGQILVLGGLIEDRFITEKSKVPLLGDIPVIGALFRSESRERRRTNLMVFLRPVVLRDADSSARFSTDRYDALRLRQQQSQPPSSLVMPINEAPVLGPAKPAPAKTVTPFGPGEREAP